MGKYEKQIKINKYLTFSVTSENKKKYTFSIHHHNLPPKSCWEKKKNIPKIKIYQ